MAAKTKETRSGVGDPPEYLQVRAKELWIELAELLGDDLLAIDRPMFEGLCASYGAMQAALEDLNTRGTLIRGRSKDKSADDDDGEPAMVKNPSNQVAREQATQFREFAKEFGLSPGARKRLAMQMSKPKAADPNAPAID